LSSPLLQEIRPKRTRQLATPPPVQYMGSSDISVY
jgi:hypothetical protein